MAESRQLLADDRHALGESDEETLQTLRNSIQIGCEADRHQLTLELFRTWTWPADRRIADQFEKYGLALLRRMEPVQAESLLSVAPEDPRAARSRLVSLQHDEPARRKSASSRRSTPRPRPGW